MIVNENMKAEIFIDVPGKISAVLQYCYVTLSVISSCPLFYRTKLNNVAVTKNKSL